MNYTAAGSEIRISDVSDFDPVRIFECGQCFRWNMQPDGSYIGVAKDRAARVRLENNTVIISGNDDEFQNIWRDYFDFDRDYAKIRESLRIDEYMTKAAEFGKGIRILRQDRWEALCSFIISQCNNISRIKGIVERLCRGFGDKIIFEGEEYYTFPEARRIAKLTSAELSDLRAGYRAGYILSAAKAVEDGTLELEKLDTLSSDEARKILKTLPGVGDKVADCMILFGLNKLDAFPKDVWIKRAVAENYAGGLNPKVFGEYAGVAQQYIFFYARSCERREFQIE